MAGILVAKTAFSCELEDGLTHAIRVGTTVREGHPITKGREEYFRPFVVDMEYTPTPAKTTPPKVTVGKKAGS